MGELDDLLDEWGQSKTPPVDGAFVNRLDVSLREQMSADDERRGAFGWLFRPGVFVVAAAVVVVGLVIGLGQRDGSEVGVADSQIPSTSPPTTSGSALSTASSSTTSTSASEVAPTTIATVPDDGTRQTPESTTTSTPSTTTSPPTTASTTTTTTSEAIATTVPSTPDPEVAPLPIPNVAAQQNGRQLTVGWRVDITGVDVSGWVLLATVDGNTETLASSRDATTRQIVATITDANALYRIEGRSADGSVVFDSGEIAVNPDE